MTDQASKLRALVMDHEPAESTVIPEPSGSAQIIAVTSGKGGVGKTTSASCSSMRISGWLTLMSCSAWSSAGTWAISLWRISCRRT
jgi:hypothetical protein